MIELCQEAFDCIYSDLCAQENGSELIRRIWNRHCELCGDSCNRIVYRDDLDDLVCELGLSSFDLIESGVSGDCHSEDDYFRFRDCGWSDHLYSADDEEELVEEDEICNAIVDLLEYDESHEAIRAFFAEFGLSFESLRGEFKSYYDEDEYDLSKVNTIPDIELVSCDWDWLADEYLLIDEDEEDEEGKIVYKGNFNIHSGEKYTATYLIDEDIHTADCESLDAAKKYLDRLMSEGVIAEY